MNWIYFQVEQLHLNYLYDAAEHVPTGQSSKSNPPPQKKLARMKYSTAKKKQNKLNLGKRELQENENTVQIEFSSLLSKRALLNSYFDE